MYTEICKEMEEEERDRKIKKKKRKKDISPWIFSFIFSMLFNSSIYKDISRINLILYNKSREYLSS